MFPLALTHRTHPFTVPNVYLSHHRLAKTIALALPSMQQLVSTEDSKHLSTVCSQNHPHAYSLFSWILGSNQSYIVSLQGKHRISSMGTKYQFLMRSASPEGENYFNTLKKKHGTVFGFHGSQIENWHSILRNGIKNMSGTALQLNGAAYGSGVYISPSKYIH